MRFIPSMVDEQRTTDDTFVAPELKLFSINEEPMNLSCDEMFSIKIRNDKKKRTVVVGSPGSGKSTLIHNRIAYDWGRTAKHQHIKLLFVIDMCKVKPESDVFEIIKDQLLRSAQREKLEELMEENAQSTAFLLDGFDEVTWKGEGNGKSLSAVLDSTWLSGSHVIVTTRPEKLHDFNKQYQGYTQVDLLGFSDAAVLDFIQKEVGKLSSNASANNLERAIANLSPSLLWMSKNPLTLSMLCILWKDNDQLPNGVTSLYSNVVDFMMERSYSDTDPAEPIPDVEHVLKVVGKFALQDLSGQRVIAKDVPAEYLQVSRRMGICSTHKKRDKFKLIEFVTFPLHRTFQEFCAAKYLADIADTNQDVFLSAITPVVDNKSLLQFCCGLSLTAASTILQQIVRATAVNVKRVDACIFGVGPRVANPWKLPLLLLFEAESQISVESAQTRVQLHALLGPLVKSIRMNHGNWPADNEMCHLLQYFISKKDDKSWLSQVKFAGINLCTKVDIGPSLAREQTELVESLSKLNRLELSSSISQSRGSCTHILRNLRIPKYIDNESDIQHCQRTEVIFSGFDVCEIDFITFLSNQIVPFTVKLDTVTLVEETESKSHVTINSLDELIVCTGKCKRLRVRVSGIFSRYSKCKGQSLATINSLNELIVCDSKCKGQSLGTVLSRMLSNSQVPVRLSLQWTSLTKTYKGVINKLFRSASVSYRANYRKDPTEKISYQHPTAPRRLRVDAAEKHTEIQRQGLAFDCFSSYPLSKSILTNLLLSGRALTLQALTNMLKSQHVLSEITLQRVYLSGKVNDKCVHESVKMCILKNVSFSHNLGTFFQQFPEVTNYHMSDIFEDEIVDGIVTLTSLQNVTISKCTLGNNVNALFRGRTPKLQYIDLAHNGVNSDGASALAQSFQHTPALQHLNLTDNSIGSDGASALAQSFQHTPTLQHLDLGWNSIDSDGASALAQSFKHTPALQYLDLTGNYDNSIGANGASELAQSFQHTPALQYLDLNCNRIGSDGTSALARSFKHTPALQHLSLDRNRIGSDGASALAQSFLHTPALQHISLGRNMIGSDGASALARSFQHTPALQHLDLASNNIGSDGASALAQSLQHTPALQHLDLASNSIDSDGASALAQSFQHTSALQHLNLRNNSIGSDGASALAQSFQHTPALQHLNLQYNRIGSDGAPTLAQSFRITTALQHINLSYNYIDSDRASALAQLFQHTPVLQHLDLASNIIGPDEASALAQSFQHTPELQYLDLKRNRIDSDGASALAQSFQHTPALQHLDLYDNSIDSDGASALAQSFQHTPALKYLDLRNNSIGPDGATSLAQSFRHTPALQNLYLNYNSIGSKGVSALAQSFQHTPVLQHLGLSNNSIDSDGASALAQSFQHLSELRSLYISFNKSIGSQGVEDLFRNLIHLQQLQELGLEGIELSDKQCSTLLDCCRKIGVQSLSSDRLHISV
ncbi:uncharacterized protein [Amphiura filiformis]|uniref:uncharacterized protein n=1 Tax=Amphiura filiformis TaxID=82378 RepID=UPI003B20E586